MSRTRMKNRQPARALSESDTEDDVIIHQNRENLKRLKINNNISHLNSTSERISSESNQRQHSSLNHHYLTKDDSTSVISRNCRSATTLTNTYNSTPTGIPVLNQSNFSPESPLLDISAVQCSTIDKLRWLLWRYIYLKIILSVNFDVWLLSRLRGKHKAVILFLLPLLIYLFYGTISSENLIKTKHLDVIKSTLLSLFSYIYSWISFPFLYSQALFKEETSELSDTSSYALPDSCSGMFAILSSISSLPGAISNYFFQSKQTDSIISNGNSQVLTPNLDTSDKIPSKEEYKLLALEVLEEKLSEIMKNIKRTQANENVQSGINNNLQYELSGLKLEFQSLSSIIAKLENDVENLERSTTSKESDNTQNNLQFNSLNSQMKAFEEKLESLSAIKRCCDEKWTPSDFIAAIEKHLSAAFKSITVSGKKNSPYYFFNEWLSSNFVNGNKLSADINEAYEKIKLQQVPETKLDPRNLKVIQDIVQQHVEAMKRNLTLLAATDQLNEGTFSLADVKRIVKEAIMLYDADKIGLVDYALESGGGSVLGTRCSESYVDKNGKFSVFGLPLWSEQNSPRTAIQPTIQPGKCWAFKGSQGFLVIQLSYTIRPTGFTLEHIPVSLSPTGLIDSAPREFSVWGLSSETDNEGTLLGLYSYDQNGEPLQYFPLQNMTTEVFSFVELKIHSNHGNLEYTCLYRFRVHGTRME